MRPAKPRSEKFEMTFPRGKVNPDFFGRLAF